MAKRISSQDRKWAQDRIECLELMIEALDNDLLTLCEGGEWHRFWRQMRRLYSKAAVYLATGVRTGDKRCLGSGMMMWEEVRTMIQVAEHRLGVGPPL